MKKISLRIGAVVLSVFALTIIIGTKVQAEEDHDAIFAEAKILIDQKTPCDTLSDEQLEIIGEYYMEQMHPGEAHELMDTMMGGEDSASLRQAHISMAKRLYCGEKSGSGMMGMMVNGMMGGYSVVDTDTNTNFYKSMMNNNQQFRGYGMMNGFWNNGFSITSVLSWLFLVAGISAFVKYLLKK